MYSPDSPIFTHTLPCGLRVVCQKSPTDVVYCGLAVDAGTRDELPTESGLAHFTEHLSFKGTTHRRAWHITNRMERVGGDLNAFTGKEDTVYYCTCLRPHLARAIDVLADIVLCSTYPQHEMDREVEVVASEIESYNDSPSELIYDEFEALLFQGHPLGRNILGEAEHLRRTTTHQMSRFADRMYRPERMVLFVYGRVEPTAVVRLAERAVASHLVEKDRPTTPQRTALPPYVPQAVERQIDTHQAHVMMGCRAYGGLHPRQLPLFLLNHLLGGPGMNSRLCQSLREKRGLVYTVESSLTTYTDTGVWAVYFGCEPGRVAQYRRLVMRELERLTAGPLSASALSALKQQILGQLGVGYDNFENVAISMGKRFLHYRHVQTPAELAERIHALTAADLWATAQEMFRPEQITTLTYL